jgi:hypothetical protein
MDTPPELRRGVPIHRSARIPLDAGVVLGRDVLTHAKVEHKTVATSCASQGSRRSERLSSAWSEAVRRLTIVRSASTDSIDSSDRPGVALLWDGASGRERYGTSNEDGRLRTEWRALELMIPAAVGKRRGGCEGDLLVVRAPCDNLSTICLGSDRDNWSLPMCDRRLISRPTAHYPGFVGYR